MCGKLGLWVARSQDLQIRLKWNSKWAQRFVRRIFCAKRGFHTKPGFREIRVQRFCRMMGFRQIFRFWLVRPDLGAQGGLKIAKSGAVARLVVHMTRRAALWELNINIVRTEPDQFSFVQIAWNLHFRVWGVRKSCFLHFPAGAVQNEIVFSPVVALRILIFWTPPGRECDFWNVRTWTN